MLAGAGAAGAHSRTRAGSAAVSRAVRSRRLMARRYAAPPPNATDPLLGGLDRRRLERRGPEDAGELGAQRRAGRNAVGRAEAQDADAVGGQEVEDNLALPREVLEHVLELLDDRGR